MFAVVDFTTIYERYVTVLIFELFRIFLIGMASISAFGTLSNVEIIVSQFSIFSSFINFLVKAKLFKLLISNITFMPELWVSYSKLDQLCSIPTKSLIEMLIFLIVTNLI